MGQQYRAPKLDELVSVELLADTSDGILLGFRHDEQGVIGTIHGRTIIELRVVGHGPEEQLERRYAVLKLLRRLLPPTEPTLKDPREDDDGGAPVPAALPAPEPSPPFSAQEPLPVRPREQFSGAPVDPMLEEAEHVG